MSDSDQPTRREYSPADIIAHIQRLADGNDPPTASEFRADDDTPATATVRTHFGNWNTAVEAAGFQPRSRHQQQKQWSDAEIITHIQRLADGDDPPTQQEFNADTDAPSVPTVRRYFGSWNDAIEAAGYQPREGHRGRKQWSDAEIITHIQRLADGDNPPTRSEFTVDTDAPSAKTVERYFNSWNQAIQAAGLEPYTPSQQYSETELITHIQRLATDGNPPTQSEFDADDDAPSVATVQNYFGTWSDGVEAAGLKPQSARVLYSRNELINWLIAYRAEFGVWPTSRDIVDWPGPSMAPYRREFGTFTQALEATKEEINNE
jgi:hypothetical protein